MLDPLPGPPRHVGPYRLLATIGAGGMGEVYLARAPGPGAPLVAVKTVRPDLEIDREFRIRFRREIAAARAVTGAGTAALLDGDADAEVPWLATEYVAGPSLAATVVRCGPLPPGAVRALGAGLARALAAVHDAQVLHRDLKPGNVLLTPEGPTLIDFGIARALDATALTAAGMVVGTPGFMAPEQLQGGPAVVPASDVFTLGAVLCFAACGRGPFDDQELASVIFRIAQGDADLSDVPEELRDVISACLCPAPGDRPTAAELAARLAHDDATAATAAIGSTVPWPAPVLALFAEHREAVARCERATAQGSFATAATAAGTDGRTPRLPTPPPPVPLAPPDSGPSPRRRRRSWIAAAVVAAAAVTVAAVLLPGDGNGNGNSNGSGGANGNGEGTGDAGSPRVVTEYGNPDRSGEFGAAARAASARPEGWKPWSAERPESLDDRGYGCVLVGPKLVCRDGKGAATALDAATGAHRWTSRGFTDGADALQGIQTVPPESDGERVYVPSERGVIALDAASGAERWRKPMPATAAVMGLARSEGVLYTAEFGFADGESGSGEAIVRARRGRDGHTLWTSKPLPSKVREALVVKEGRVYAALEGGGVVALSAKDGSRAASAPGEHCTGVVAHRDAILCWALDRAGIRELDAMTLKPRRTLAPDRTPALPPSVGEADVLVVTSRNEDTEAPITHFMTAYDWRSGDRLWRYGAPRDTVTVALSGKRILAVGRYEMWGRSTADDKDSYRRKTIPHPDDGTAYDDVQTLGPPLYVGGALFAVARDGRILSGYAP
ncbi:protein kinase domain-containing protein [Streptomyces formicae]|uniref:Putative serine/threonine protein kinase n=1 Tax=Streptomyces formicae TaxID=1616117 RepID=A0A291QFV9_9ACTN|nr:serine/threonine-protein kinase [Streptomyces formicae]ATL30599.1 putative serine/threonine protein kinase [Streptomyces formicae]